MPDVVVVGAGHNGLVAAVLLARSGLSVQVLERADVLGGASRTERPFHRAPELASSTGAYLLGLMPPELIRLLDLRVPADLPLIRRDPHYFLPTPDRRYLLLGADRAESRRQIAELFGEADARADQALAAELAALRTDLAPAWLAQPTPVEQTAQRYIRPALREVFVDLVRGSAMEYLDRFGFTSPTLLAMYAVTDGSPGLTGSPWSAGSGHNLLVHNMCRQPGADGTWMMVRGGMGTVTRLLAGAAIGAGARIRTGTEVARVTVDGGAASGVSTVDDERVPARAVLVATDPFRLTDLAAGHLPTGLAARLSEWGRASLGQTMKVNLALSGLPRFAALGEDRGQYGTTAHLLPPVSDRDLLVALRAAFDDAAAGRLPAAPPVEWYLHSTVDRSLQDGGRHQSSALFVQGVPHEVAGSSWRDERDGYVQRLLDVLERYAPGTRDLVVEVMALSPPDLTSYFGITGGNIHHINNTFSFTDRMPYATGVPGLYAGSAGCYPAGSVIGCAGHNAAMLMISELSATFQR